LVNCGFNQFFGFLDILAYGNKPACRVVFIARLLMIKNKILINNGGQYKQQTEICQKLYSKK
jgi:hypothetical protein